MMCWYTSIRSKHVHLFICQFIIQNYAGASLRNFFEAILMTRSSTWFGRMHFILRVSRNKHAWLLPPSLYACEASNLCESWTRWPQICVICELAAQAVRAWITCCHHIIPMSFFRYLSPQTLRVRMNAFLDPSMCWPEFGYSCELGSMGVAC